MELYIKIANNGYILTAYDMENYTAVYQHIDGRSDLEALREMLSDVIDLVGASGSRHGKERLYVKIEPGDKYEAGE